MSLTPSRKYKQRIKIELTFSHFNTRFHSSLILYALPVHLPRQVSGQLFNDPKILVFPCVLQCFLHRRGSKATSTSRWLQRSQNATKMVAKMVHVGAKTRPRCSKMGPRWLMLAPRCSKMTHVGAEMFQDGVRMAHVGAKMLQDGAKMGHVGAKMRPRSSEMASTCLAAAVLRPRWARMMRQATQMRPKTRKIFPTCIK